MLGDLITFEADVDHKKYQVKIGSMDASGRYGGDSTATVASIRVVKQGNDTTTIGVAHRNPIDKHDPEIARKLAFRRAVKTLLDQLVIKPAEYQLLWNLFFYSTGYSPKH